MPWLIGFFGRFFLRFFGGAGKFLLGFLSPLIAPVMQFIASFFKKVTILALIVAALYTAITVLSAGLSGLINQITGGFPDELIAFGRMFLPDNISFCISVLVTARVKSLIFYWVSRLSEKLIHT
ncbi:DUF5455 family protein [Pseudomonas segetis]